MYRVIRAKLKHKLLYQWPYLFVCSLCDKSYSRKDYLDRHIKATHHSGEEPDNEEGILSSFLPGPTNPKRMKMTQKCEIEDTTEELSDINQMVEVKLEAEDEDEDSESFSETRGNIKAELQVWSLNIVRQIFMLNSEHVNHLFVCRAKQSFQIPSLHKKTSYLS